MRKYQVILLSLPILSMIFFYGCSGARTNETYKEETTEETSTEVETIPDAPGISSTEADMIFSTAFQEQKKTMYAKDADTIFLYWLNNRILELGYQSRCNIFALNTLYKAGFKCPDVNTLTRDMMDTTRFNDIFKYIRVDTIAQIKKGDLLVWNGHVIIFEKLIKSRNQYFAQAIWAGTTKEDDGTTVINNVIYGKYPLDGYFIIRRPVKK
jgi:hypothetical protein